MSLNFLLDSSYEAAFEAASCVGLEFMMFVVATSAYLLLVGGVGGAVVPLKMSPGKKVALAAKNHPWKSKVRGATQAQAGGEAESGLQAAISSIRAQGRAGNLQGAVAAFEKLRASERSLSPQVHNCLIEAYIQCKDLSGALQHFKDVARTGTADIVTYNTVLKALLGLQRTEEAKQLLREMAKRGLPASRVTFHELLHAEVMAGNGRGMWQVVEDMRAAGHTADAVTCSILAKSLKDGAHPWNIERVMTLVAEIGGPVDDVLLSSVVEGCVRLRRMDLLSTVMARFQGAGSALKLTATSYGSLIKAYGQAGEVARVRELWQQMSEREVKATSVTLGCMVDALVTNGCVEDAWDLVNKVHNDEEMSALVNTVIYSTMLKGFSQARNLKSVFRVVAEMTDREIPFNVISYNTTIDACARCGAMERAPALLESMRKGGLEPDLVTYSTLVKGYSLAGDVDRGFKVLKEMRAGGKLKPDEIMYNSLLDGCAREHRVDQALELLEIMQAAGIAPSNHTLSILVKLLGRARKLDKAFKVVEDLTARHGFRPNIQVYTCLIQACFNNRRLDRAMAALDTMSSDSSCRPDERAYSVLVRGCLQANGLDEAVHSLRCAYQLPAGDEVTASASLRKRHPAPGAEKELVSEAMARLRASSPSHREVARLLAADLKVHHGLDVDALARPAGTRVHAGKTAYRARCA
jgi:pentatricopeptide repeat protein